MPTYAGIVVTDYQKAMCKSIDGQLALFQGGSWSTFMERLCLVAGVTVVHCSQSDTLLQATGKLYLPPSAYIYMKSC